MPFLTEYDDDPVDGGTGGMLQAPLIYHSDRYMQTIAVPVGFYSDYGSVPWWVPPGIVPRGAAYRPAYYVHDYLYGNPDIMSKAEADVVLRDAMAELKPKRKLRAWIAWAGVTLNLKRLLNWNPSE